jgi:hypothetical protein
MIDKYEYQVLCSLLGFDVPGLSWGAAMGAALEFLKGSRLVVNVMGKYSPTVRAQQAVYEYLQAHNEGISMGDKVSIHGVLFPIKGVLPVGEQVRVTIDKDLNLEF